MRSFILLLVGCAWLGADVAWAQYKTLGDARPMGECIRLTSDEPYSEGIAYNTSRLDLAQFFEIEFDIFLGNKDDDGADGITFVIHDDARGFGAFGSWGEGMGYGNMGRGGSYIAPSVAVEFDTYQNYSQNDPPQDHVALLVNGVNYHPDAQHWSNVNDAENIEDDKLHNFRFRWDPKAQLIQVYLDGRRVCNAKKDLIGNVFNGKTSAIWGFTASTGAKHNLQYFCLKRIAHRPLPTYLGGVAAIQPPRLKPVGSRATTSRSARRAVLQR